MRCECIIDVKDDIEWVIVSSLSMYKMMEFVVCSDLSISQKRVDEFVFVKFHTA